jgi:hypothetical protein
MNTGKTTRESEIRSEFERLVKACCSLEEVSNGLPGRLEAILRELGPTPTNEVCEKSPECRVPLGREVSKLAQRVYAVVAILKDIDERCEL